jgi:hypothetical protein
MLPEAFATECEAIAIEQSPDQIDEIHTASGDARLLIVDRILLAFD